MKERSETLDVFTIATATRRIGIDSGEIEKVVTGLLQTARDNPMIKEFQAQGRFHRLTDLLCLKESEAYESALVVRSEDGSNRLLAFSGSMDVERIAGTDISPVPAYVRQRQRPFVVWGFCARREGPLMLVTFQYLPQGGSS